MSEPVTIGKTLGPWFDAWVERMKLKVTTPEHIARVEAYKREKLAKEQAEQMEIADIRGLPRDPEVRTVALTAECRMTTAMKLVKHALWKRTEQEPRLLVMGGGVGSGKTCSLAKAVMLHPKLARYRTAYQCQKLDVEAMSADLLVIDEVGTGNPGNIPDLLLELWSNGTAVIMAGNVTKDFVWDRLFSEPIRSRVARLQD
jgi:DNA replication protein DnaC